MPYIYASTRVTNTFAYDDVPFDPIRAELTLIDPNGKRYTYDLSSPEMEHPGLGSLYVEFKPDVVGKWLYAWSGTNISGDEYYDTGSMMVKGRL